MNVLALAYLGDSIYEIYIRTFLLEQGIVKVKELQEKAIKYVSAKAQRFYLESLINNQILTEEEIVIVKRARNHKSTSHPKNTDIITYKYATGLEALIGHLYLEKNQKRIDEIMQYIINYQKYNEK